MFCEKCGAEINDGAVVCVKCGCAVNRANNNPSGEAKNWVVAYLLSWFLGGLGAHRFYLGKIGTGLAMLFTLGGCGIWSVIDFICLSFDKFTDAENRPLTGYIKVLGMIGFGLLIAAILLYALFFMLGLIGAVAGA